MYQYSVKERKAIQYCRKCKYCVVGTGGIPTCDYIGIIGKRRPCKGPLFSEDGKCEAFERMPRKRSISRSPGDNSTGKNTNQHKAAGLVLIQSLYTNNYNIYENLRDKAIAEYKCDHVLTKEEAVRILEEYKKANEQ